MTRTVPMTHQRVSSTAVSARAETESPGGDATRAGSTNTGLFHVPSTRRTSLPPPVLYATALPLAAPEQHAIQREHVRVWKGMRELDAMSALWDHSTLQAAEV